MNAIAFHPRRLGHVNLWVSDLEKSIRFYEQVCGIEFVRRERLIKIGFHSNGNTHHDIGLVEISRGFDRVGRDGRVQIPANRGTAVGLNHLGWEMTSEADLVAAYHRAEPAIRPKLRTADHLISHSIYVTDPDGNSHEFYADAIEDWRSIYHLGREDEVSSTWQPGSVGDPTPKFDPAPAFRKIADAAIHPSHLIAATFATHHFDAMLDFFVNVGGLAAVATTHDNGRSVRLAGSAKRPDLHLNEVASDDATGLRSFTFALLDDDVDVKQLADRCKSSGVAAPRISESSAAQRIAVTDPDGFDIAFEAAA